MRLRERLETYCSQIPVLGFNWSKYNINLIKSKLFNHLDITDTSSKSFTVKRQNSYLVISTPKYRFLDISHFIAPDHSYSNFLKSYKSVESKGVFCYDYLTKPEVLDETSLPGYDAFYSPLKGENLLQSEFNK